MEFFWFFEMDELGVSEGNNFNISKKLKVFF